MRIERTSQMVKGKGLITKQTKTEKSRRVLDLSDYVIKLLKNYKVWQMKRKLKLGDVWKYETDRLFTQESGLPTCPDTITSWFRKFVDKTELPPIHIHSLRHINATLMISLGIDIRTVSRQIAVIPTVLRHWEYIATLFIPQVKRQLQNWKRCYYNKIVYIR